MLLKKSLVVVSCITQTFQLNQILHAGSSREASPTASKTPLLQDPGASDMEELKREYEAREQKALGQVEEIKTKSRKMVALLQSQLKEATGKLTSERGRLETEIAELKEQLTQERDVSKNLKETVNSLKDEMAALLESIRQKEEEIEQLKQQLREHKEMLSSQKQCGTPSPLRSGLLTATEQPVQSPMQSMSTIPLVALEEVLSPQSHMEDSQLLVSSSADMGRSNAFLPLSLEQSQISMDPAPLGSPLGQQLPNGGQATPPPQCTLSMLAMSRLSHHSSSMPQVS